MTENRPESENREPQLVGDIIPGVLEGIKRREEVRELLEEQQKLFGSPDLADQERLQEIHDELKDFTDDPNQ